MMLQGHFISTMLMPEYRDTTNSVYSIWLYFRGNTAPAFFTISGLIFTYLLLKSNDKGDDNPRIKKGLKRGLELIGIGYLLRIPFLSWFSGHFNTYFLVIDVLQCIGLSLILLVLTYLLVYKNRRVYSILLLTIGLGVFLTEPLYRNLTLTNVPEFFANYVSMQYGSVFTILPWFGFMAFGAFIATLFYKYAHRPKFKIATISLFIISGLALSLLSTPVLLGLYDLTQIELLSKCAHYNYLFLRLGNVLVAFGIFYALEQFLKHSLITKIGKKTLSIYVVHFILIYGSFIGFGLRHIWADNLNPWQAIIGAILFIIVTCIIVFQLGTIASFFTKLIQPIRSIFKQQKK